MAIPDIIRPGGRIAQEYLNALRETARRAAIQIAGPGLSSQETPGGMAVMQNPEAEARENCARMEYPSPSLLGLTLPAGSLVHLLENAQFDLADVTGRVRLGVLQEGAAPGDCPWVQYQGIAQVYWDFTSRPAWFDWTSPSPDSGAVDPVGHRLGARQNSPFPVWDDNGPLMVLHDEESDYDLESGDPLWPLVADAGRTGPKLHRATVAFLHNRESDSLFCSQPGFLGEGLWINAPYDCLVFGTSFSVTEAGGDVYAAV